MNRWRLLGLLAAALLLLASFNWRWLEAGLLLADLTAGGDALSGWLREPPQRLPGAFPAIPADLYRPARPMAGIVLVPGLSPHGKDDPLLVAVALALGRAGFAVAVPDIADLRQARIAAADKEPIAAAVAELLRRPDLAPDGRIGIAAFSYAVGPAVLAALKPEMAGQVDFLLLVGGYYSLDRLVGWYTTGADGELEVRPAPWSKWFFLLANAHRIESPYDEQSLRVLANRRIRDEQAPIEDLLTHLTADGRAIAELILNRMPARVAGLLAGLPRALGEELRALDLSRADLSSLKARLLVVHGRNDGIVPVSHAVALADAAANADLFLLENLMHVDMTFDAADFFTLWQAAHRLLALRDGTLPSGKARRP